ncbi:hypothetical protein BGY98DRAFT_1045855 [Russula aff. rugulosa BPL654]|nr:hypothetical protein BGY98DRAFT_1045855 [Russula aff. rugulosa BPL654]
MSKPVLYTFPGSVWAAAPNLALAELGIDADFSEVNLVEGANFTRNPNGTLPPLPTRGSHTRALRK